MTNFHALKIDIMTQEEKDLVLKDISARLPYELKGLYSWKNREPYNRELTGCLFDELKSSWNSTGDSQFLPYLRPLSSMTEEEMIDFLQVMDLSHVSKRFINDFKSGNFSIMANMSNYARNIDWLNAHHFDYRGLIGKSLAIEVTEENNPYKD